MKKLRSHNWFWGGQETGLLHRGALRSAGIDMDRYTGQPIIGIANTWSEFNNCNLTLQIIAEQVKAGVREAGGIPLEFPVLSLGEELMKPTAMLYRNLLSMDVEENIRSYPIDGVVLLGNCDKTVPGLLMGAASANLPTIQLNGGPKRVGMFRGRRMGSGTDLWRYWEQRRLGQISPEDWEEIGKSLSCGAGSCNTMGTASTMNALLEGLGMMPLGLSTLPPDSPRRMTLSHDAGRRIVDMVKEDLKPADILTPPAFDNAIALCMALGGSTNALLHLTAIAGRRNISLYPGRFQAIGAMIPCITNVEPVGEKLMDEFDASGGVPAVLQVLKGRLDLSVITYLGETLERSLVKEAASFMSSTPAVASQAPAKGSSAPSAVASVIRTLETPVRPAPTITILQGNLAPRGAVLKTAAASPGLLVHRGRAIVFDNYSDMLARIDDSQLDADASSVLILRYAGPKAVPGMPEWGMIPIPKKLQQQGVTDMVRISDARMSGTSFGTVILHACPEAAEGGALAMVCDGDWVELNIPQKKLELLVSPEELAARKARWTSPPIEHTRGYPALYTREVLQADEGCDFGFLRPSNAEQLQFIEPVVGRS